MARRLGVTWFGSIFWFREQVSSASQQKKGSCGESAKSHPIFRDFSRLIQLDVVLQLIFRDFSRLIRLMLRWNFATLI